MLPRRLTRCSRADVLWSVALFIAGQLGLAVAIEYKLAGLRDPRYACRAEPLIRRATGAGPESLSVVILGSSRVQDGLNSSELEERLSRQLDSPVVIYNFGIPAAGPVANLLHFERLSAAGVKPDLLIVEVAPMLLGGLAGRPQEAGYYAADRLWRHELALVERYGLPAGELRCDWWQDWAVPCHAHRFAIVSRLLPNLLPAWHRLDGDREVDGSGWRLRNDQPLTADDRRGALEHAWKDFGVPLQSFALCEAACRAQRDLLQNCRQRQVAAALIWMPEGKLFQTWYPPTAVIEIRRYLQRLCEEFDVPLIDARNWVEDEYFVDGQHLRSLGAARFTERLGREILTPILTVARHGWHEYLASLRRDGPRRTAQVASRPTAAAQ
jgi:hypothetical protein